MIRLQKLRGSLGSWEAVADAMDSSRAHVLRLNKEDYPINEKHIQKLEKAEKKAGIAKSSTELLLRQMLVDRLAHIFTELKDDQAAFEKLAGRPFDSSWLSLDTPLPSDQVLRRLCDFGLKDMAVYIEEAHSALKEIDEAKKTISAAEDKIRNLIFYTRQRDAAGLLKDDPLLKVVNAYISEKSG
jgi:hypothetical protein